ncbi:para-nitrobenzyl esterase [Eilatimonas milleporae]|uniref:Para-nitrobenzyl esterase n=2 Tax=Eilatimonas milleporae TaxID=911205 RepID=A0A3M0BVM7_9PROT|nr:para-nitrobenzyl esterase [Eilatimonas milleporae]
MIYNLNNCIFRHGGGKLPRRRHTGTAGVFRFGEISGGIEEGSRNACGFFKGDKHMHGDKTRTWIFGCLTAAGLMLAVPAAGTAQQAPLKPACMAGTEIMLDNGAVICGRDAATTYYTPPSGTPKTTSTVRHLGIRYARSQRWRYATPYSYDPKQHTADNPYQATDFGPSCPQAGTALEMSEDCLFVNVFTPGDPSGDSLPVMVFIHGGAFIAGSSSVKASEDSYLYDGGPLAATGEVIVVTLNYRLGALGFLAVNLDRKTRYNGNQGLHDQLLALNWVRRNIRAFGGDPDRITIFGESAGAMSVGLHMFTVPQAQGKFRAGIMESNPMNYVYRNLRNARSSGDSFAERLCKGTTGRKRCTSAQKAKALADASYEDIVTYQVPGGVLGDASETGPTLPTNLLTVTPGGAVPKAGATALPNANALPIGNNLVKMFLPWTPTVTGTASDPIAVTHQPYEAYQHGSFTKVPFIFGVNRDEGAIFASMAQAGAGSKLNKTNYGWLLRGLSPVHKDAIEACKNNDNPPPSTHQPYAPKDQNFPTYYKDTADVAGTLANVITDFAFYCGNTNAAANAADNDYAYLFTKVPPVNLYPRDMNGNPNPTCAPENGLVCHGAELLYVFQSPLLNEDGGTADDRAVSARMATAWRAFAVAPTSPPWAAWKPGDAKTLEVFGPPSGWSQTLPAHANCPTLWNSVAAASGKGRLRASCVNDR